MQDGPLSPEEILIQEQQRSTRAACRVRGLAGPSVAVETPASAQPSLHGALPTGLHQAPPPLCPASSLPRP